jgi:hypothetical protein
MKTVISAMALVAFAGVANAQQLLWDFNSQPSDSATGTGTLLPIIGTGSISLIGGTTSTFASGNTGGGSSDTEVANDSELSVSTWSAQGVGSGDRGIEFAFSTLNYNSNFFDFDVRFSNSMSKFVEVLVSVGGGSFSSLGVITGAGDTRFNNQSIALGAAADNQADVRVRVVSIFAPSTSAYATANPASAYAATGTLRIDMVSVEGTLVPTPGAAALVGLGGLVIARRRR